MAETVNSIHATASTRKSGQWKLVAGLAGVLIFLVAFSGSEEESDESTEASSDASAPTVADNMASSSASSASREIRWPEVPMEFLLTHNPFRPDVPESRNAAADFDIDDPSDAVSVDTASLDILSSNSALIGNDAATANEDATTETNSSIRHAQEATQKSSPTPDAISGMTVQMLFRSARGNAAMIDDRVYHIGDQVNGFEIASIGHEGVTLRMAETQQQPSGQ